MDIKEIAKKLSEDTFTVCRHLLPNGDRKGSEYFVGSVKGEKGESCRIHLTGVKAGVWADFSKNTGGDLIDLWMAVKGLDKGSAVKEIKEFLNIHDTPNFYVQEKTFTKPVIADYTHVKSDYLNNRGITEETIRAFKLAEKTVNYKDGNFLSMVFPSFKDGELVRVKYIAYERSEGKKRVSLHPDCKPILFGWHLIPENTREICICEGEINAMSLSQYGFPTLALPLGAGKGQPWIEYELESLDLFDTIYLRMDKDEAGDIAVQEIASRLGYHRCKIMSMEQDPNDLLQSYLKDGKDPKEEFSRYFKSAAYFVPEEFKTPDFYIEKAIRLRYPLEQEGGFSPKFRVIQTNGPKINFRRSETSVWTGYNFSGKSTFLKQMVLDGVSAGEKFLIVSPEEPGAHIVNDLTHMAKAIPPTDGMMREVSSWLSDKIWICDVLDSIDKKTLFEYMEFAVRKFGVTQIIMDSIMCIDDVSEESIDSQRAAINAFLAFGKKFNCHNHVVAHPRKPQTDDFPPRPNRFSISGSSKFSDRADNVFGVWRNERKEAAIRGDFELKPEEFEKILREPSAIFSTFKQKWGTRWVGNVGLHFESEAHRYVDFTGGEPQKPIPYI